MCRCEVYGYSPNVMITRPPASFLDSCCDQKLRYDLEWPNNQNLYRAKRARNLKTVLRSEERIATQEQ